MGRPEQEQLERRRFQGHAEAFGNRLRLSPRGYTRILRVARTIADLSGAETVQRQHVAEALAFSVDQA